MQYSFKFNIKKISSVLIVLLAYEFNLFSATYKKMLSKSFKSWNIELNTLLNYYLFVSKQNPHNHFSTV